MLASRTIARQAKTTTATVASKKTASRGQTIVRKNSKGGEEGARAYNNDAFGMIAKAASYSLFGAAITKADVEGEFTCEGPITVFAPNDDAFADFAKASGLSKVEIMNFPGLKDVLLNHVAKGKFTAAEGLPAEITMVSGKKVSTAGMSFKKNDIKVDNATIHAITTVIA
mmetsp:Transcript_7026/g.15675  ORF Transcript_7026/g.15675 Transcript_7026/m.15675 type:complete len:170 (-) Transcript_7026:252-761(-)